MVVITTDGITWIMFFLMILTGNMGYVFLWFFIWMPIAFNLKIEMNSREMMAKFREAQNIQNVDIEGSVVRASPVQQSSEELTVGMSMGES